MMKFSLWISFVFLILTKAFPFAPKTRSSIYRHPLSPPPTTRTSLVLSSSNTTSTTDSSDSIDQNDDDDQHHQLGAWIPIGSASSLKGLSPTKIEIMGTDFVVWNNPITDEWSVLADICPHRLAPLSQGRINEDTGCVQCGYHGWEFGIDGTVTEIPQLEQDRKDDITNKIQPATSFAVHMTGDLIWAFLPTSLHGESFPKSVLPEDYYVPGIKMDMARDATYYVHEMPSSMHMTIENGMDPAHFPFAHCGVISRRDDAAPIPDMKVETFNFTNIDVYLTYKRRGEPRERLYSYQRPSLLYTQERSYDDDTNRIWVPGSLFFIVPVREGKCRLITSVAKLTKSYVPEWITHLATRRLFEGDCFVHDAEINLRQKNLKYIQPTNSDTGPRAWNKWMKTFGFCDSPPHTFGLASAENLVPMNHGEKNDPWKIHTKNCSKCRKVLFRARKTQLWSVIVGILGGATLLHERFTRPILAALTLCSGILISLLAKKVTTLLEGSIHPSDIPDRDYAMTVK